MNNFFAQANSSFMYIACGSIIVLVMLCCTFFLLSAYKEGIKMNMDKSVLKKVITSSALFTIIPSIGIFLGVITLSGSLGVPVPWLRLSVIGALHYEIMAAEIAGKAAGLASLSGELMNIDLLVTMLLVMSIGIIWGGIFCTIGLKKYQSKIKTSTGKDDKWGQIIFNALFIGMVCAFIGVSFADVANGSLVGLIVTITSFISMGICDYLIKKKNFKWLDNFALSLSMVCGMAVAILIG